MSVIERDKHSGALIFHKDQHEIDIDEQRGDLQGLVQTVEDLKSDLVAAKSQITKLTNRVKALEDAKGGVK